ncbi:hypothetical protein [Streptomyces sp. NPDC051657]|uniref:hypothetical protein n=1 Tax=unclassified Streptomyces TaxID=2593676 RepID=UPI003418CCFC
MRVNHTYGRGGALAYLAAYDVHHAQVFGRNEPRTGIDPFMNPVTQVMTQEPYASAPMRPVYARLECARHRRPPRSRAASRRHCALHQLSTPCVRTLTRHTHDEVDAGRSSPSWATLR